MDKEGWNALLVVVAIAIVAVALVTFRESRPRRRLLIPLTISSIVSGVIFASTVDGADSFHGAAVLVLLVAAAVGFIVHRLCLVEDLRAALAWSLLGTVVPPAALLGLLLIFCSGGRCFS